MFGLRDGESSNAAGDDDTAAVRLRFLQGKGCVGHGLPGGDHRHLREAAHALGLGLAQVVLRDEALDLRRQLDFLGGGVKLGDRRDAAHSVLHGLPALPSGEAQGRQGPHSSDDNSSFAHGVSSYMAMPPSTASTCPVI